MWAFAIFVATVFLAYANGANDNFKGVATLFGSQTTNYKIAIWWATTTTFAGSICSVIFANALLKNYSYYNWFSYFYYPWDYRGINRDWFSCDRYSIEFCSFR